MASSYGAEATQGERYRLSFTVGGLLASQGRALAEMYLNHLNHAGGGDAECSSQTEVGKSIAAIRQQAIEETFLRFARIPRTGALWRKLLGDSVRSRLESLHIWQARIPPHPTARHLCGSRCAVITQSSGNSPAKYLKSIILPAIRIWTLRIMIGSLRTKPHGILNWKP